MSAPRSILAESVLSHDRLQRVVEDREPREGHVLADGKWRVDANRRRVRHRDEPPPETFLVERLRHRLRERFFRRAIAHQLDAEHQAPAADLAHALVLLLELLEPAE